MDGTWTGHGRVYCLNVLTQFRDILTCTGVVFKCLTEEHQCNLKCVYISKISSFTSKFSSSLTVLKNSYTVTNIPDTNKNKIEYINLTKALKVLLNK